MAASHSPRYHKLPLPHRNYTSVQRPLLSSLVVFPGGRLKLINCGLPAIQPSPFLSQLDPEHLKVALLLAQLWKTVQKACLVVLHVHVFLSFYWSSLSLAAVRTNLQVQQSHQTKIAYCYRLVPVFSTLRK